MKKFIEPYIIAEIGANHNGNLNIAKKTIFEAKKAGCDAVKFQSWDEKLFSNNFYIKNPSLLKDVLKFKINFKNLSILRKFAKKHKIDFGTAIFDKKQLLEALKIKCDFIKIASMDINNYYLLNLVSKIKIPLIISTGTATKKEIIKASKIFHNNKKKNVIFLHCLSLYPPKNLRFINLNNIILLRKLTKFETGYSDHSILPEIPLIAATLGSKVIEKHFTLSKKMTGWDHSISADPKDMKKIVSTTKLSKTILGNFHRILSKEEKKSSKIMRRGLYAIRNIEKGERFNEKNLILQRPETKFGANFYSKIIGKKSKKKILANTEIKRKDF